MVDKIQVSLIEVMALLSKGYSTGELKGVDQEHLDALYALAYQHYNADNFTDAANIFKVLNLCDPNNEDYLMGLASCEYGLKNYEQSAELYMLSSALSGFVNPKPVYFAALSALKLGKKDDAIAALESMAVMGREGEIEDLRYKQKAVELIKVLKA